jgi:hypothetical protein
MVWLHRASSIEHRASSIEQKKGPAANGGAGKI